MAGKQTGAHREKRLTAAGVKNESRPGRHMDGNGLFLFVDKTGAKRWGQRLMISGNRRDIGLGPYPVVGLAEARTAAQGNKEMARRGLDPIEVRRNAEAQSEAEKRALDNIPTFKDMVDEVCNKKSQELTNKKHAAQWRSTLETYACPVIGDKKVSEITVQDVLRTLTPVWERAPETGSRLRGRIETVLNRATVLGHRSGENPARWRGNLSELLISPFRSHNINRQPTIDLRQVPFWWQQLQKREGMAARALEFVTLTAARSGEVRGTTWDEIDLERKLWIVPADRMKGRIEHLVPLSQPAVKLLDSLPRLATSNLVFFAPRGGELSDMSLSAVMRRMQQSEVERLDKIERQAGRQILDIPRGFVDRFSERPAVPHGLRTCFRSWAADQTQYNYELSELALAHRIGNKVSRAYNRADLLERRRTMMQHWADFLDGKVGLFEDYQADGKVVSFRA